MLGHHLQGGFKQLWADRQKFSDVTLFVGGHEVPSHRLVLASWSPVLKALLERWVDTRGERPTVTVDLGTDCGRHDRLEHFLEFLRFFYTSACRIDGANCLALLRLSNYYAVLPLKEACGDFMIKHAVENNIGGLLALADRFEMHGMRRQLLEHLGLNFEALLEKGMLACLPLDVWRDTLSRSALAVPSEEAVLDAVMAYADALPERAAQDAALQQLLPCVRLPLLGPKVLVARIEQSARLMALPITKELLCNTYRTLFRQRYEVSEAGDLDIVSQLSEPLMQVTTAAGSARPGGEDVLEGMRLLCVMQAQGQKRQLLPTFDANMAPGMVLSDGRTTVTAGTGGLVKGLDPEVFLRAGAARDGGAAGAIGTAAGDLEGAGHGLVVTPGMLCPRCWVEFKVVRAPTGLQGVAQLAVWVVYSPRLEETGGAEPALTLHHPAAVFVSGASLPGPERYVAASDGTLDPATGCVARVLPPHLTGPNGPRAPYCNVDMAPSMTYGVKEGDAIGVQIEMRAPMPERTSSNLVKANVIFRRNGAVMSSRVLQLRPGAQRPVAPAGCRYPSDGFPCGPELAGAARLESSRFCDKFYVVVSTRVPGTSVSLQRGAGTLPKEWKGATRWRDNPWFTPPDLMRELERPRAPQDPGGQLPGRAWGANAQLRAGVAAPAPAGPYGRYVLPMQVMQQWPGADYVNDYHAWQNPGAAPGVAAAGPAGDNDYDSDDMDDGRDEAAALAESDEDDVDADDIDEEPW
ncbi:hypothetical protein WJX81_007624 [Elliptochloris bilobata]|uniref:BTB domain-containing protein n=1 Tax=Elliptochloris bilobata TaxID=381761 RepID=A0AAW1SEE7_9CHLO